MRKSIDSVGPRPEKKKVEPVVTHKAGEVFRPKGAALEAGEQAKPKNYVDPKTQEAKANVTTEAEHAVNRKRVSGYRHKKLLMIFSIVAVVLAVIGTSVILIGYAQRYAQKQNDKKYINQACTAQNKDLLDASITSINSQDLDSLSTQVNKIREIDHYNLDQNCLAVITWQAILTGDVNSARASAQPISSFYDPNQEKGVAGVIYTSNPEKLGSSIDALENRLKQREKNQNDLNTGVQTDG